MLNEDQEDLSILMAAEIVHAMSESSSAARKTISKELEFDDKLKDISIYEFLELKLEKRQLPYDLSSRLLRILFREFEYFNALIQNLIGFYSAGKPLELDRFPTDVKRLLEEVIALFEGLAKEKKLKIELSVAGDAVLTIDKQLIRRVFINLLDNAVKYSYESVVDERFIKISCHRYSNNNDWIVSFESYGVGITQEEISNGTIFNYGSRGELSDDRGRKGTGIGLAETKRIIDAHGGRVLISSINKNGDAYLTTIKIILPFNGGYRRNARHWSTLAGR